MLTESDINELEGLEASDIALDGESDGVKELEPFVPMMITSNSDICKHRIRKLPCHFKSSYEKTNYQRIGFYPTVCCKRHKKYEYLYISWQEAFFNALNERVELPNSYYEIQDSYYCHNSYNNSYDNDEDDDRDRSNRCCQSVCRCYKINNVMIIRGFDKEMGLNIAEQVCNNLISFANTNQIITNLTDKSKRDDREKRETEKEIEIAVLILNRLVSIYIRDYINRKDNTFLEPLWIQGYYGDEFDNFNLTILSKIKETITAGITLEKLLNLEYNDVVDVGQSRSVKIIDVVEIPIENIIIPNKHHFDKCLLENSYKDYKGIICVCMKTNNNQYTLKDGYHRLASAKIRQDKTVKIVCAEFS